MTLYSSPLVYLSKLHQIHAVPVDFLGEKKYFSGFISGKHKGSKIY